MRILFDSSTPGPLARALRSHEVSFTRRLRWHSLEDGDLLDVSEQAGFELLITCDHGFRYRQNLRGRKLGIVILSTNHWPTLKPFATRIATAVDSHRRAKSRASI